MNAATLEGSDGEPLIRSTASVSRRRDHQLGGVGRTARRLRLPQCGM